MQNNILSILATLSDAALVSRVKSLVARHRHATAHLVAHLAELDTRDVHLREGYSSLFVYCRGALGLSEGETGNRIAVTARVEAPPSKTIASSPDRSAMVPAPIPSRPAEVTPLSPDRYKLQLTIAGETLEKLRLAQDMLSHAVPSGDPAAVLDRALSALLADLAKKRFADTPRPRRSQGPTDPRDLSAEVKRTVYIRDLGRCTYIGPSGHRCHERRFVQFHHLDPRALGGEATPDRVTLRCGAHNRYDATLYFGKRAQDGAQSGKDGSDVVREETNRYGTWGEHVLEHVLEHAGARGTVRAEATANEVGSRYGVLRLPVDTASSGWRESLASLPTPHASG